MIKVGDIIDKGTSEIPAEVLELDDGTGGHSVWERVGADDKWCCIGTRLVDADGPWVVEVYGPLTVTKVRELKPLPTTKGNCPRCGLPAKLHAIYGVCLLCAAASGWDPKCEACLAESRDYRVSRDDHVVTCDPGRRAKRRQSHGSAPVTLALDQQRQQTVDSFVLLLAHNRFATLAAVLSQVFDAGVEAGRAVDGPLTEVPE